MIDFIPLQRIAEDEFADIVQCTQPHEGLRQFLQFARKHLSSPAPAR